jgi:WD40 repeat protein
VGDGSGNVELWDVTKSKQLRTMRGHTDRVPVLGWNAHILASGCRNGQVRLHVFLSTINGRYYARLSVNNCFYLLNGNFFRSSQIMKFNKPKINAFAAS